MKYLLIMMVSTHFFGANDHPTIKGIYDSKDECMAEYKKRECSDCYPSFCVDEDAYQRLINPNGEVK